MLASFQKLELAQPLGLGGRLQSRTSAVDRTPAAAASEAYAGTLGRGLGLPPRPSPADDRTIGPDRDPSDDPI
jgi:hypothetical protein